MSASAAEAGAPPQGLLRHPNYPFFWSSRVLSSMGYQAASVVIGWKVYEDTGSAYALGLIGLVQFLPVLLLTFVVGHVADRFDRRRVVLTCQAVECLTLAAMTAGIVTQVLTVPGLFVAVVMLGATRAFEGPTIAALLPGIVPPILLPRATALSSSAMQTATIVGPSLGGLLYGFGAEVPMLAAAICFAGAATAMALVRFERQPPRREPVTLQSVFTGVNFIWSRKLVLGAVSLDLFAVLLGGVTALLPIFAQDVLQIGPFGLGLLRSSPAIGAVAMSLVLAKTDLQRRVGLKMFAAVVVFGLATVVFASSTVFALSCAALIVLGAADNVSVVIRHSLVLLQTPDEMRGRVNAVTSLFVGASNQLGEFYAGMVAGTIGAVPAGILGGFATILVALTWMRLFPQLRKADGFQS